VSLRDWYAMETDFITLEQAAELCVGNPHRSTVWRWARNGVQTPGGVVRLRTGKQGRRTVTTRAWISEFTIASAATAPACQVLTPACDADEQCEREGI